VVGVKLKKVGEKKGIYGVCGRINTTTLKTGDLDDRRRRSRVMTLFIPKGSFITDAAGNHECPGSL
jgi:hypothetical protein